MTPRISRGQNHPSSLFLLFVFLLGPFPVLAGEQVREWAVTYDSGGPDQVGCTHCDQSPISLIPASVRSVHAVAADAGGSSWIAGGTSNGTNADILTARYDGRGLEQWAMTYDGGGDDSAGAVAVDVAGNVYVAGTTYRTTAESGVQAHALLLKYDPDGNLLWERVYRKGVWSQGLALAVDPAGRSFLAVQSSDQDEILSAELLATSPSGEELESDAANFGFEAELQSPSAVALDAGGNAYMVGWLLKPFAQNQTDYFVLQYGGWAKRWDSGSEDVAYDVAVDGTGRVFVAGNRGLTAFNSTGTFLWSSSFPGLAHAVAAGDGGVWVTGSYGENYQTARYNPTNGVRSWTRSSGGPGTDAAYVLHLIEGTIFVAGTSSNGSDDDVLVVGLDAATGAEVWHDRYDQKGNERVVAMTAAGTGLWVAGDAGEDTLTLRYSLRRVRPRQ